MEFTAENIEKAVKQFYQDAGCQQEINIWLMRAQVSPQAWQFSWPLLNPEMPPEVQFFGASSLHIKISRYWSELKPEQIEGLRSQLLQHVVRFVTGPKMVFTRLCIALSSLVLQTTPEIWPEPVASLIDTFQQQNLPHLQPSQVCLLLLELLTVLPEEMGTAHLPQRRVGLVRGELKKGVPQVLGMLQSLLVSTSPQPVFEQSLRCLSSWIQFGVELNAVESLAVQVFSALSNELYFDTAVETLVHVFQSHDNYRYPLSLAKLIPHVLSLQQLWSSAVQNQDMEKLQGLTKLLVTVADNNTKLILTHARGDVTQSQPVLTLVNMILQCTGVAGYYPVDECCSDLPFGFWYNLQDEIVSSDREEFVVLAPVFTPVYMSLVNVLLHKVKYPPEEEYNSWDSDEKDSYRCYRQDIADTLMYAYAFLHHPLLGSLCQLLGQIVERAKSENVPWQDIEAVLYAVSSVADSVETEECVYLPVLFKMLGSLPLNHHKLVSSALFLIGAYAEWISQHNEVLSSVLPLLLQGLTDPELAQAATLSLKDVLRENQAHVHEYVPAILHAAKHALEGGKLKSRDALRLMCCVGYVLSVLPVPQIMEYLNVLLAPYMTELQQLSQLQGPPRAVDKLQVQHNINMLFWLFGSLNIHWERDENAGEENETSDVTQPTQLVLRELMPTLQQTLSVWGSDPAVIECTCDMLKRAVRTLLTQTSPLYAPISALIQQLYTHTPHPALLDLGKQLLVLFAHDGEHGHVSKQLFSELCSHTLKMFEKGDIREHPDILEGFLSFLSQIAKKNKNLLCEDVSFSRMFQAGVLGLSMPEAATVKSSCQFLVEFISLSERVSAINDTVRQQGQSLVDTLLRAIGGESPRAVIDTMADVFLALNRHQCEALCHWLNSVIQRHGFPNARVSQNSKETFARRILMERSSKRRVKEIVQENTLLWRGLLGSEYAVQTSF